MLWAYSLAGIAAGLIVGRWWVIPVPVFVLVLMYSTRATTGPKLEGHLGAAIVIITSLIVVGCTAGAVVVRKTLGWWVRLGAPPTG